jgi:hypothetical protein
MNSKQALVLLLATATLVLTACGGSNEATPTQVRPAPGGTVSGAEGTAEPDALTPTPTPTTAPTSTPTLTKTPRPVATARAVVERVAVGTYDVTVVLKVTKLGLSAVDVLATANGGHVSIDSVQAGTALGNDPLVGAEAVEEGGAEAHLAFARRGASEPGDVDAEVAHFTLQASNVDDVLDSLAIQIEFTDAGLALHGPITVALVEG